MRKQFKLMVRFNQHDKKKLPHGSIREDFVRQESSLYLVEGRIPWLQSTSYIHVNWLI